jgi:hypothetical protein
MMNNIQALVDALWQSDDLWREALKARSALTPTDENRLRELAQMFEQRAMARRTLASRASAEPGCPVDMTHQRLEGLLVLLMLAVYHSDGLFNLPLELREARLHQWAQTTRYSVDVVREASILGATGILPFFSGAIAVP